MVIGDHFPRGGGPQRRYRYRQGIVGSLLPVFPVCSSRTRAASLGCTSSTRSPAAISCWASRRPSPGAPSTAHVRSGQACAQPTSSSACAGQARTRILPSGSSAAPSLPGYGFSAAPGAVGWDPGRTAHAWAELMSRLGYTRYVGGR
jgi:hypothetical protein